MATDIARTEVAVPAPSHRVGWVVGGLAALALAGVVVAGVAVLSQSPIVSSIDEGRVTPLYTQDDLAVMQLVAKGLIPEETLEGEPFRTKRLIAQGLVPRETLEQLLMPVSPLYCPEERALMAAVAAGVVPEEVLEEEPFRTKRLIAQGLIPREAADLC